MANKYLLLSQTYFGGDLGVTLELKCSHKHWEQVSDAIVTLNEGKGHGTENIIIIIIDL